MSEQAKESAAKTETKKSVEIPKSPEQAKDLCDKLNSAEAIAKMRSATRDQFESQISRIRNTKDYNKIAT
jgi:hypothetical protein